MTHIRHTENVGDAPLSGVAEALHTGYAYVVYISQRRSRGPTSGGGAMSVRQAMLALLEPGPMYGYQLRAEFEQRTGATWPLNVGQVYTTLSRLERDGLVEHVAGSGADDVDRADRAAQVMYRITPSGRGEVSAWFTTP